MYVNIIRWPVLWMFLATLTSDLFTSLSARDLEKRINEARGETGFGGMAKNFACALRMQLA